MDKNTEPKRLTQYPETWKIMRTLENSPLLVGVTIVTVFADVATRVAFQYSVRSFTYTALLQYMFINIIVALICRTRTLHRKDRRTGRRGRPYIQRVIFGEPDQTLPPSGISDKKPDKTAKTIQYEDHRFR